jgi:hypothetical protein
MDGRVVIAILFAHRLFLASGFLRWLGRPRAMTYKSTILTLV